MYRSLVIWLSALLILLALPAAAPAWACTSQGLLKQGDALYAQRGEPGIPSQAVDFYSQALKKDPACFQAAWRLTAMLFWVAKHAEEERLGEIHHHGREAAQTAIRLNPQKPSGHFWFGIHTLFYTLTHGPLTTLSYVQDVIDAMHKVLELDPDYMQGGAERTLGRIYYELPGLFGGDNQKAENYLLKSLKKGPHFYLTHIFLADLYADTGRKDEAHKLLEEVIKGPAPQGYEPEYVFWKKWAANLREKLNSSGINHESR